MRNYAEYTILNAVTPVAITSSTDATPIVVTATAHGFATGDLVLIYAHATNVAANGIYKVTRLSSSTFSLQDRYSGSNVAGSGAGAGGGTGFCMVAPKIVLAQDFKSCNVTITTTGTATMTLNTAGSNGKLAEDASLSHGDTPNFGATDSKTNPYSFLYNVNLESGAGLAGDTGIVLAAADTTSKVYEYNVNGIKYLTVFPSAWTQGVITVKASLFIGE